MNISVYTVGVQLDKCDDVSVCIWTFLFARQVSSDASFIALLPIKPNMSIIPYMPIMSIMPIMSYMPTMPYMPFMSIMPYMPNIPIMDIVKQLVKCSCQIHFPGNS